MATIRESLEAASAAPLRRLAALPRAVPFLAILGLMAAGILIPQWGWVLLLGVTAFLAWLLLLGWPRLTIPERIMRIAVIAMATAITITQAFPR